MEFLNNWPWYAAPITVILFTVCLSFLIRAVAVTVRKTGAILSIGKVKIGSSVPKEENENTNGHRSCAQWKDFLYVYKLSVRMAKKVITIDKFDTLREQMSFAEQCISDIRSSMRSRFLKLLKEVKGLDTADGLLAMHESSDYLNILRVLTFELKDQARSIFSENHLTDMSEAEFEIYLKRKIKSVDDNMDTWYYHDSFEESKGL